MAEDDAARARDPVDGALDPARELHDELFATNLRQELRDVLQPHGEAAGALAQKLIGAIDCGVDNAEATPTQLVTGLKQTARSG